MTGIDPACNGPEPIRGRESSRGCEPFSGKAARAAGATCPRLAGLGRVGGSPVVSLRFHHSHPGRNPAKPNSANKTTGRIKGVTANSLRNSAEIGNQPVDGTKRDPRGRWVAGAECPGGLCQVACTHILRLAQEGSAARTIRRDLSALAYELEIGDDRHGIRPRCRGHSERTDRSLGAR